MTMTMTNKHDDDELMADGQTLRVPLMMRDSMRCGFRDVTDAKQQLRDAVDAYRAEMSSAWQRPLNRCDAAPPAGRSHQTDGLLLTRDEAYRRYVDDMSNGWRTRL